MVKRKALVVRGSVASPYYNAPDAGAKEEIDGPFDYQRRGDGALR